MTPRRPPVLAQTLLEWVDPANDALHGDLLEEFAAGRSRLWYWRQVIAAAGVAFARPVRAHGLAGLEPAMLGVMMLLMLGFYVVFVVNVTDWLLRFEGFHIFALMPAWLARWPLAAPLLSLLGGLVVGRVVCAGGDHRVARIVGFGAATMLCAIAGLQAAEELSVPFGPSRARRRRRQSTRSPRSSMRFAHTTSSRSATRTATARASCSLKRLFAIRGFQQSPMTLSGSPGTRVIRTGWIASFVVNRSPSWLYARSGPRPPLRMRSPSTRPSSTRSGR
jgi:hypothetical protein